ncbi:enolase-phosphatase E1 [Antennarius striatus]|uniref:enolase-phosphatase E1 n=1 Tax=Antennarius striatus TaxID=241820 RepID=UPI0035B16BF0
MEALTEGLEVSDVDTEMTAIIADQHTDDRDEVEDLRNSLRQAIHDDSVQPKMQCLMMDSSFSMVTVQGEDSGIAWETTPSHFTTPWASQAEKSSELIPPVAIQPATSGSVPAGKIIFVMDEELFSRRKKSKEKMNGQKSNSSRHREVTTQSSEDISGRPELVGVSQPNVKTEEGDEQEPNDPSINKEQRLFQLVSEGSEILNIVVPPKLYTVDEEESKEMVDNLSYLEESFVSKISEETNDYELVVSTTGSGAAGAGQVKPPPSSVMDPPGAPVARPLGSRAVCNVDYFEAYSLIDVQAPGSPALGQVEQELRVYTDSQDTKKPVKSKENTTMATTRVDKDKSDAISIGEINCELLDDVFYGGTESYNKNVNENVSEATPTRVPLKPTGSTLFGSQEDILTPIFLPDGPPKIIDPMLLEEPKAMAFLYTDLYEEAVGSREKEADAESVTSEKSFHSRNSDREARGYLEKYVLIDETPVMEHTDKQIFPEETSWILSQDLYEFGDFISKHEKNEIPSSEEEITDFFRSSANSSPCDKEPFAQSLKKDEAEPTKTKDKTNKSVSIKVEKVIETPVDQLSISSFEFPLEETDWGSTDDYKLNDKYGHIDFWKQDTEVEKPVAPPRRKERSSSKTCLDLTPLIPIDLIQEKEETGENEQKEEEKKMPYLAETTVKEDGGGQQTTQTSYSVAAAKGVFAAEESVRDESVKDDNEITITPSADEAKDARTVEMSENEAAIKQTESGEANTKSSTSAETESCQEKQSDSLTLSSTEPAKDKGQCVIL